MFLISACSFFVQYIETKYKVENEDVVGAALTGDAPTASEWSIISLHIYVRLISETWRQSVNIELDHL